jgi:hypothetical protein
MDEHELRTLLEQLHNEIEKTKSVDEQGRELLRHLDTDIRGLLARSEGERIQPRSSVIQRLEDSIDHFEVTHPVLTTMLSRMLDILSNAGI